MPSVKRGKYFTVEEIKVKWVKILFSGFCGRVNFLLPQTYTSYVCKAKSIVQSNTPADSSYRTRNCIMLQSALALQTSLYDRQWVMDYAMSNCACQRLVYQLFELGEHGYKLLRTIH